MLDLKPYYDAVNAASDQVQLVAKEIDELFTAGTQESKAQALALRQKLEQAQANHADAVAMYEAMQKANRPNDIAKNFVPMSKTNPNDAEGSQPTVIKRQQYEGMSLIERAKFIRSGGTLED